MFQEFRHIPLVSADHVEEIVQSGHVSEPLSLRSPACEVMTDFCNVEAVHAREQTPLADALEYMKRQHVRFLCVVDKQGHFSGVLTAHDVNQVLEAREGRPLGKLKVGQVMMPKSALSALPYERLCEASIGDVLLTLKNQGDQHILVVERNGTETIRGVVSSSEISRKLRISFEVMYEAKSFAEIEKEIAPAGHL